MMRAFLFRGGTATLFAAWVLIPCWQCTADVSLPSVRNSYSLEISGIVNTSIPGASDDDDDTDITTGTTGTYATSASDSVPAASTYDANNYATSDLTLSAFLWNSGQSYAGSSTALQIDEYAIVESSVSYGYTDVIASSMADGYYTVDNNNSYPTAGEDEDSATAHIILGFSVVGSHQVGNPRFAAYLYASVSDYPGNGRDSWVEMEALDSDGLYYTAIGVLQQSSSSDPTADPLEVDDVVTWLQNSYGATVSTQVGGSFMTRAIISEVNGVQVGYTTDFLDGYDSRHYNMYAIYYVTTPTP